MSPQVCVHRCPVCAAPLPACSLVSDGWVWVPLTAPGPALLRGYVLTHPLHVPLWGRKAGEGPRLLLSSYRTFTSSIFISHLLLFEKLAGVGAERFF